MGNRKKGSDSNRGKEMEEQNVRRWLKEGCPLDLEASGLLRRLDQDDHEAVSQTLARLKEMADQGSLRAALGVAQLLQADPSPKNLREAKTILRELVSQRFAPAYAILAECLTGQKGKTTRKEALSLLIAGSRLKDPQALQMLSQALVQKNTRLDPDVFQEFVKNLLYCARKGSPEALESLLPLCRSRANILPRGTLQKIRKILQNLAAQNNPDALIQLAAGQETGMFPGGPDKAILTMRRAWETGDLRCGLILANLLTEKGSPSEKQEGLALLERLHEAGVPLSARLLGQQLALKTDWESRMRALKLLQDAAAEGTAEALIDLYWSLLVEPGPGAVRAWFIAGLKKHADHERARWRLALLALSGIEGEAEPEKGLAELEALAKEGFAPACGSLADIFQDGLYGIRPDPERAALWIERGCALDNLRCRYRKDLLVSPGNLAPAIIREIEELSRDAVCSQEPLAVMDWILIHCQILEKLPLTDEIAQCVLDNCREGTGLCLRSFLREGDTAALMRMARELDSPENISLSLVAEKLEETSPDLFTWPGPSPLEKLSRGLLEAAARAGEPEAAARLCLQDDGPSVWLSWATGPGPEEGDSRPSAAGDSGDPPACSSRTADRLALAVSLKEPEKKAEARARLAGLAAQGSALAALRLGTDLLREAEPDTAEAGPLLRRAFGAGLEEARLPLAMALRRQGGLERFEESLRLIREGAEKERLDCLLRLARDVRDYPLFLPESEFKSLAELLYRNWMCGRRNCLPALTGVLALPLARAHLKDLRRWTKNRLLERCYTGRSEAAIPLARLLADEGDIEQSKECLKTLREGKNEEAGALLGCLLFASEKKKEKSRGLSLLERFSEGETAEALLVLGRELTKSSSRNRREEAWKILRRAAELGEKEEYVRLIQREFNLYWDPDTRRHMLRLLQDPLVADLPQTRRRLALWTLQGLVADPRGLDLPGPRGTGKRTKKSDIAREKARQEALDILRELARQSFGPACGSLGVILGHGLLGVEKDEEEAARWTARGCRLFDPESLVLAAVSELNEAPVGSDAETRAGDSLENIAIQESCLGQIQFITLLLQKLARAELTPQISLTFAALTLNTAVCMANWNADTAAFLALLELGTGPGADFLADTLTMALTMQLFVPGVSDSKTLEGFVDYCLHMAEDTGEPSPLTAKGLLTRPDGFAVFPDAPRKGRKTSRRR